ncbi:MAG: hypothetical protein U1E65_34460 [Myxococcota bacterium]
MHLVGDGAVEGVPDAGALPDAAVVQDAATGFDPGSAWLRRAGPGATADAVDLDPQGAVISAGWLRESLDLGAGPRQGDAAMGYTPWAAKHRPDGTLEWLLTFTGHRGTIDGRGLRVAVGPDGSVIVAGAYHGPLDLGQGPLPSDQGSFDLFIAKFDPAGTPLWTHGYSGPKYQGPSEVVVAPDGAVWIAGVFEQGIRLGAFELSAVDGDTFVAKLNPDGEVLFAAGFGGPGDDSSYGMALAPEGGVLVVGGYSTEFNAGAAGKLISHDAMAYDGYLLRLGADGAPIWARSVDGDAGRKVVVGAVYDPQGDLIISGLYSGSLDSLGSPSLLAPAGLLPFVAKLNPDGTPKWKLGLGDEGAFARRPLVVDADGRVHHWSSSALTGAVVEHLIAPDGTLFPDPISSRGAHVAVAAYRLGVVALAGEAAGQPEFGVPDLTASGGPASCFLVRR